MRFKVARRVRSDKSGEENAIDVFLAVNVFKDILRDVRIFWHLADLISFFWAWAIDKHYVGLW